MNRLLVLILIIVGHFAFGQNQYPTKSQLLKHLQKNTKRNGRFYNSTKWFTCKNDSTFYKADTLEFFNNSNYQNKIHVCDFIDWNFYKRKAFWLQKVQLCKEPTTASMAKDTYFYTFKIIEDKKSLKLEIIRQGTLVDMFEVLSISKFKFGNQVNDVTDVLTLVRIRKL